MLKFMLKALIKIIVFLGGAGIIGLALSGPMNLVLHWVLQPLRWIGLSESPLRDIGVTGRVEWTANYFSLTLGLLIASWLMTRFESRPIASLGLGGGVSWLTELALGILLAFLTMIPVILMLHFFDPHIPIRPPQMRYSIPADWLTLGGGIMLGLLILFGALFEELTFRGYPFQTLMSAIGWWPTVIVTSGIFGIVHSTTHEASAWIAAGILGLFMALLYLRSKSLWIVTGFHAGINGVMAISAALGLIIFPQREPTENWLYPGMTGAMALILALWVFTYLKPSSKMEVLWQQHVPIAQPWAQLKGWWARRRQTPHDQTPPKG